MADMTYSDGVQQPQSGIRMYPPANGPNQPQPPVSH